MIVFDRVTPEVRRSIQEQADLEIQNTVLDDSISIFENLVENMSIKKRVELIEMFRNPNSLPPEAKLLLSIFNENITDCYNMSEKISEAVKSENSKFDKKVIVNIDKTLHLGGKLKKKPTLEVIKNSIEAARIQLINDVEQFEKETEKKMDIIDLYTGVIKILDRMLLAFATTDTKYYYTIDLNKVEDEEINKLLNTVIKLLQDIVKLLVVTDIASLMLFSSGTLSSILSVFLVIGITCRIYPRIKFAVYKLYATILKPLTKYLNKAKVKNKTLKILIKFINAYVLILDVDSKNLTVAEHTYDNFSNFFIMEDEESDEETTDDETSEEPEEQPEGDTATDDEGGEQPEDADTAEEEPQEDEGMGFDEETFGSQDSEFRQKEKLTYCTDQIMKLNKLVNDYYTELINDDIYRSIMHDEDNSYNEVLGEYINELDTLVDNVKLLSEEIKTIDDPKIALFRLAELNTAFKLVDENIAKIIKSSEETE